MIRNKCIEISCKKAKHNTNLKKVLLKKIDVVTNELPKSIESEDRLVTLQEELNRLRTEKMNGLIVRSRLQHFEILRAIKKSTKFFFDCSKSNYKKKTITQLLIHEKIINDEDKILEELAKYYDRLYREEHMTSTFHLLEGESYNLHFL